MFKAVFKLARPLNVLITILSVWIAAYLANPSSGWFWVGLASLAAAFIAAGANTINDYYDVEADRINKPQRPLPAGEISASRAFGTAWIEFIVGILLGFLVSVEIGLITLVIAALLFWYSYSLKKTGLSGNMLVSFICGFTFIYGALVAGNIREGYFPAIFAVLFHLGREILKAMQDIPGDVSRGIRTFPLKWGRGSALRLLRGLFSLLAVFTFIPFAIHWYSLNYFLIVLMGIYPVLLITAFNLKKDDSPRRIGFFSNLIKADMVIGLIALYFK